jgi:Uncharacterized protein conserved in bacteria
MNTKQKNALEAALTADAAIQSAIAIREMATRLWKLRITRQLSPEIVARDTNISLRLLHKVESGRYNFSLDVLFRLCEYYKVDPDEIFCRAVEQVSEA